MSDVILNPFGRILDLAFFGDNLRLSDDLFLGPRCISQSRMDCRRMCSGAESGELDLDWDVMLIVGSHRPTAKEQ